MWGQLVSFQELTAGHDKVKTSVENEPRIYKEKKVYELQTLGHPKGGVRPIRQAC